MSELLRLSDERIEAFRRNFKGEMYRQLYTVFKFGNEWIVNNECYYPVSDWTLQEALEDYVSEKATFNDRYAEYCAYAD